MRDGIRAAYDYTLLAARNGDYDNFCSWCAFVRRVYGYPAFLRVRSAAMRIHGGTMVGDGRFRSYETSAAISAERSIYRRELTGGNLDLFDLMCEGL
jgi:hypothetical protein